MSDRAATRQRAATVAEKPVLLGQRVGAGQLDFRNPGGRQTRRAIAGQVELPASLARPVGEEPRIVRPPEPAPRRAGRRRPRRTPGRCKGRLRRRSARCGRQAVPSPPMVASMTPATAPRQPAWAAPTTPAVGIGEQHRRAVGGDDTQRQARLPVTMASARGPAPGAQGGSTVDDGGAVDLGAARKALLTPRRWRQRPGQRFCSTAARSSGLDRLQFRLANGPLDTPPRRVKNPCGTGNSATCSDSAIRTLEFVPPLRAADSGSQRAITGYTGKIAVRSRLGNPAPLPGRIANKTVRLQKLRADRDFPVAARDVQHISRPGQPGDPPA